MEIDELNRMVTYQVNAESGEELNRNDLPLISEEAEVDLGRPSFD